MYDLETDILSIEISKGKINNTKEFGNFILHISKTGKPIFLEILDATKIFKNFSVLKIFDKLNKKKLANQNLSLFKNIDLFRR